jgi:beta-barrel assembly-enhancing protease
VAKVFSTHPPTPDRISAAQKEIATLLPEKDEYIVTTSEFDSVKARLRNVMFARKVQDNGPGKPTLRTKTEQTKQGGQTTQGQGQPGQSDPSSSDDDRPTLKRRPDSDDPNSTSPQGGSQGGSQGGGSQGGSSSPSSTSP